MSKLTVGEILQATGGSLASGRRETEITHIETDSRKAKDGALFVPVIGQKTDGHRFIASAFQGGAGASLASTVPEGLLEEYPDRACIQVEDTIKALQSIGSFCRRRLSIPIIGVTGSVGKTTAREMIACALAGGYSRVFKTAGNHNRQVGVPIPLLEI